MKAQNIKFEYRENAFSNRILVATRKAKIEDGSAWVRVSGHWFEVTIDSIITVDDEINPEYKPAFISGDYMSTGNNHA